MAILQKFGDGVVLKIIPPNAKNMVRTSVTLFNRATVDVGMHGGGMVNIIFMRPNKSTVIYIGWKGGLTKLYVKLANRQRVTYRNVVTKGMTHRSTDVKTDILVVISEIRRALERSGFSFPSPRMKTNRKQTTLVVQPAKVIA